MSEQIDVVVAGGGLIGMCTAWRCAQRGLSVTVVDPQPGQGASYAAAGMLAPVAEVSYGEEALLDLCRTSLQRFPAFAEELQAVSGIDVGLRTAGTLVVGFDADDVRALDELCAYQEELGLDVRRLTPTESRRAEPALSTRIRGGLAVAGDHSVDARAVHQALLVAAEAVGVRLIERTVTSLLTADGRAVGLALDDGTDLRAGAVVAALGARTATLPGMPAVPVRPVKGQILRLAGAGDLLGGTVRALVRGRQVYLVPYGEGGLIVGATVEDRGFDTTVTAGAVHELLRDAVDVVPAVSELELVEAIARWRPGTPDNAPLLGRSTLPGLVLATGHYRNGVLLSPVTGDLVADVVVDLVGDRPNPQPEGEAVCRYS